MTAGLIVAAVLVVIVLWWAGVRDAYDAERWGTHPEDDYCRYGASCREVARWWISKRMGLAKSAGRE